MVDQTTNAPEGTSKVESDLADAGNRLDKERQVLSETLGGAREAVTSQARDLGDQAASRIGAEAEGLRDEAAAGLSAFSDALKAASEQLSGKKLGFAGDMVQQAAGGLESFARSLEGRSPGEMLDGIRSFGRQNPVGFIAGSVLAGFALGRIAAAVPFSSGSGSGSDFGRRSSSDFGAGAGSSFGTGSSSNFGSGAGSSLGTGSSFGTGSGTGTGMGTGMDSGTGTASGAGSSLGTGSGTVTGTDTGMASDTGTGTASGAGSSLGTGSGTGTGMGTGTASGTGSGFGYGSDPEEVERGDEPRSDIPSKPGQGGGLGQ